MFDEIQILCDKIASEGKEIGRSDSKDGITTTFIFMVDGYYYTMAKKLNEWIYLTVSHEGGV